MPTELVLVPDIGEFEDVEVIEVLVAPGDPVEVEGSLVTLESDKASMEIPSPFAGRIDAVLVSVGDLVSEGSPLVRLEVSAGAEARPSSAPTRGARPAESAPAAQPAAEHASGSRYDVVVLGGGPGGYTAAFRAADLGLRTALVERYPELGGVCLNVGCIPSKTLLSMADVIHQAEALGAHGIEFGEPRFDLARIQARKHEVVATLTKGLAGMAVARGVDVVNGDGRFLDAHRIEVDGEADPRILDFAHAIVAVGSRPVELPGIPNDDPRVLDSTGALALSEIPARLVVVGGGIIGLEMATVWAGFGSEVTVVELLPGLMPGTDPDLVRVLAKQLAARGVALHTGTRVAEVKAGPEELGVRLEGEGPDEIRCDAILIAVGRRPNGDRIEAQRAGLRVDERGFLPSDEQMRTSVPHLFSIGDVAGEPMLAHKAMHEGKVAAEVIAGEPAAWDGRRVPSVAYTDPEVAWVGLTETDAKVSGTEVEVARFPWAANGRALGLGRSEGFTKLLFEPGSRRLLGAGVVGAHAGDLIAEAVLAIELGADAEDLALTIHPHPTLSETLAGAAEVAEGTATDLPPKRRR